ncbi:MAG TPA: BON domain-containing protein [Candidatus Angelobacter sp.]|nr:BON domain-containing protein [Candidatus Angelobacter sp.]
MRSTRLLAFFVVAFTLLLGASWCFAILRPASSLQPSPKATPATPKSDAEIQKCIQDKVAASELKNQNVQVSVANGEATLAGPFSTPGHKNTAGQIARGCGAHKYILQHRRAT